MSVFVALFSGINVGGNRVVKMAELKALFEELGYAGAATYIQSGNVVFSAAQGDASGHARTIETAFEARWGFASRILVRDEAWLERAVAANPYPEVAGEPTRLHLMVLERPPVEAERAALQARCTGPERFEIKDDALYLHAPDGLGQSKFAEVLPRTLKVPGTMRNWRTVLTLLEMAEKA